MTPNTPAHRRTRARRSRFRTHSINELTFSGAHLNAKLRMEVINRQIGLELPVRKRINRVRKTRKPVGQDALATTPEALLERNEILAITQAA